MYEEIDAPFDAGAVHETVTVQSTFQVVVGAEGVEGTYAAKIVTLVELAEKLKEFRDQTYNV